MKVQDENSLNKAKGMWSCKISIDPLEFKEDLSRQVEKDKIS